MLASKSSLFCLGLEFCWSVTTIVTCPFADRQIHKLFLKSIVQLIFNREHFLVNFTIIIAKKCRSHRKCCRIKGSRDHLEQSWFDRKERVSFGGIFSPEIETIGTLSLKNSFCLYYVCLVNFRIYMLMLAIYDHFEA